MKATDNIKIQFVSFECCVTKATNTCSEYLIFITCLRKQLLYKRLNFILTLLVLA
jgi:hypothetical protein